jgi:hypothetical protein
MRLTIISDDKSVIKDGVYKVIDPLNIDPTIHAVQWYDTWGEIEFRSTRDGKPQNETIEDISQFQDIIVDWENTVWPPVVELSANTSNSEISIS